MDLTSNNRRRTEDEGKEFGKTVLLFALILILVGLMTACATLNDHVAACYDAGGKPSYTSHNGFSGSTKFDCK